MQSGENKKYISNSGIRGFEKLLEPYLLVMLVSSCKIKAPAEESYSRQCYPVRPVFSLAMCNCLPITINFDIRRIFNKQYGLLTISFISFSVYTGCGQDRSLNSFRFFTSFSAIGFGDEALKNGREEVLNVRLFWLFW